MLLDADLMQHSGGFPIVLTEASKDLLYRAVMQDAKFLCSLQVRVGTVTHNGLVPPTGVHTRLSVLKPP